MRKTLLMLGCLLLLTPNYVHAAAEGESDIPYRHMNRSQYPIAPVDKQQEEQPVWLPKRRMYVSGAVVYCSTVLSFVIYVITKNIQPIIINITCPTESVPPTH